MDYKEQQKVLHSPFDIETHKKTFINYLEIIIDSEGVCHYAVPSHNGALEKRVLDKYHIEYDEWDFYGKASQLCPRDRWCDYQEWLCEETGCIMVWGKSNSRIEGIPNDKQLATLEILRKEGLY